MSNQKIELTTDKKVKVTYVDEELDIKNKKNVVIGVRDVVYNATYNNKAIATNLFKEKVSEHKKSIKQIDSMIKEAKEEIAKQQDYIKINELTRDKVKEMVKKTESIIEEIKKLK